MLRTLLLSHGNTLLYYLASVYYIKDLYMEDTWYNNNLGLNVLMKRLVIVNLLV